METEIRPFKFLIQEEKTEPACFDYMPHSFIFSQNLKEASTGEKVFEIRTKNQNGYWQDWQAIVGEFSVYKTVKQGNKIYLFFPIEETVEDLKNLFEIRYSGFLNVSNFVDAQIISDEDIKSINLNTHQIEFFADSGNLCWSFDDRVNAWKSFEDKYFIYDNDGKRL